MLRSTLVVVLLTLSVGVSGCSGDDPAPAAAPSSSAAPTTPASEGVISPELPDIPAFSNKRQGAIDDISVDACDTDPGAVTAEGTATNSGKFPRDVVVVMSWTVGATGDVVARAIASVEDLEPGDTAPWSVKAKVPGDRTAACVPSAWAGQLKA